MLANGPPTSPGNALTATSAPVILKVATRMLIAGASVQPAGTFHCGVPTAAFASAGKVGELISIGGCPDGNAVELPPMAG